ncbi:MAG: hypothetical protein R2729_22735 [Bryobacteraceae bacterium]
MNTEITRAGDFFRPHPNLSDSVNRNVVQAEVDGGVDLRILAVGVRLQLETENRYYVLVYCGCERAWISGHPQFCPQPVLVKIHGSTWGGSMIRTAYIGRGMHLEFDHPKFRTILTSRIVEIREVQEQ